MPHQKQDYAVYEPLNTLKPIGNDIWIVDGPLLHWGYAGWTMPFPTRMTVVRLPSGEVWLHSPTHPDEDLIAQIDKLGPVAHLVSPNKIHHVTLGPWSARYPDARVWASPGVRERSQVAFTDELGDRAPPGWQGCIEQRIAHGSKAMEEVIFFHMPSRTLVLADLIENFEMSRLSGWLNRLLARIARVNDARPPLDLQLSFLGGKREMRKTVEWMLASKPDRIVIAHGKWIENNAGDAIRHAFGWALR